MAEMTDMLFDAMRQPLGGIEGVVRIKFTFAGNKLNNLGRYGSWGREVTQALKHFQIDDGIE